jgi:arylamine N-acetyltransferase
VDHEAGRQAPGLAVPALYAAAAWHYAPTMNDRQAARFLALLNQPPTTPSASGLATIVAAHLVRIPFENLSKLIRHARGLPPAIPSIDDYLDRIEHLNLGGTCYACAIHLNALLRHLGYDAALCGAAMSQPDVHAVNVVTVDGRAYLVDVGYAAPFHAPMPLDLAAPRTLAHGPHRYTLHPADPDGRHRLDHIRDGERIHGYTLDLIPRDPGHFEPAITDSFHPDSEFLNQLRIVRHLRQRSVSFRDFTVMVIDERGVRARTLADRGEVTGVLEVMLNVPAAVTAEAISALAARQEAWR